MICVICGCEVQARNGKCPVCDADAPIQPASPPLAPVACSDLVDALRESAESERLYETMSKERGAETMAACHSHAAYILEDLMRQMGSASARLIDGEEKGPQPNTCCHCGKSVGNSRFSVCDDCWTKSMSGLPNRRGQRPAMSDIDREKSVEAGSLDRLVR